MSIVGYKPYRIGPGSLNEDKSKEYSLQYLLFSNSVLDGPETCFAYMVSNVGVAYGDPYNVSATEANPYAFVKGMSAELHANPADNPDANKVKAVWRVTVKIGTLATREITAQGNPLNEPYRITFDKYEKEEPVLVDTQGKKLLNSAGDPFSEPVMRTVTYGIVVVERNEAAIDPTLINVYRNAVNASSFTLYDPITTNTLTYDARCVLCKDILPTPEYSQVLAQESTDHIGDYWRVRYVFHTLTDTWNVSTDDKGQGFDKRILNCGYNKLVSGARTRVLDSNNTPTATPVPLDSSGGVISPSGTPTYRTFRIWNELDFSLFNMSGA